MAATQTLPQAPQSSNSGKPATPPDSHMPTQTVEPLVPRRGLVTLFGYGIKVCVDRGHLILEDGIGANRRRGRFSRVRHDLKRVVVIGPDGLVSLAGLRWLADQGAAFAMLDRNGKVLTVTGPVRPSDARLRRAQALANQSGVGLWTNCGCKRHRCSETTGREHCNLIREYRPQAVDVAPAADGQRMPSRSSEPDNEYPAYSFRSPMITFASVEAFTFFL